MANFNTEFDKLILVEGGYVNDPDDAGGETYLGISRKANPNWSGWNIIDSIKKEYGTKNITSRLKTNTELTDKARTLYKSNYWDCFYLDEIPSQKIAHQMFDMCVNAGFKTAISIAQQVLGMTRTGKWSDELYLNLKSYGKR